MACSSGLYVREIDSAVKLIPDADYLWPVWARKGQQRRDTVGMCAFGGGVRPKGPGLHHTEIWCYVTMTAFLVANPYAL